MKAMKKTIVFVLVVVMMMSVMSLPASATLVEPYYSHVSGFVELYNGSTANAYIRALQAFLYHYPYTQTTIINGGGIDGGYGNATENAVKIYQEKKWPYDSTQWDGRVGTKTWTKIAGDLKVGENTGEYAYLCYNSGKVMYVDLRAEGYTYYNCNVNGVKDRYIEWH